MRTGLVRLVAAAACVHAIAGPAASQDATVSVTFDNRTTASGSVTVGSSISQIVGSLGPSATATFTNSAQFSQNDPRMPGIHEAWFGFGFQINDPQHICYLDLGAFRHAGPPAGAMWCSIQNQIAVGGDCNFDVTEPSPSRCEVRVTIR